MTARRYVPWLLLLSVVCWFQASPSHAEPAAGVDFTGRWSTDFGPVTLQQEGSTVTGSYTYGMGGRIEGNVDGFRLTFRYVEPMASGDTWFEISPDFQSFTGQWRADGTTVWLPWNGRRLTDVVTVPDEGEELPFTGLFETNWGRLRLTQTPDERVTGRYSGGRLEGDVVDDQLVFDYQQEGSVGSGWFRVGEGGALEGEWESDSGSGPWTGQRVLPEPGVVWLVILEAQWETSLAEVEYSFGDMLRTFFQRMPNVRVRHRRVLDREDYLRAAAEISFLAEPTALWLSGHGSAGRLAIEGGGIGAEEIHETLRHAENIFLVHFSSCEMMVTGVVETIREDLPTTRALTISGYGAPVDWGASAVLEILYLDLVLGRGITPRDAARILTDELRFAGDAPTPDSPLGALQFRVD